jgi:hypothetical protein
MKVFWAIQARVGLLLQRLKIKLIEFGIVHSHRKPAGV